VTWELVYTKQAQKDAKKLASSGLKNKAKLLLDIIQKDPYQKSWLAICQALIHAASIFSIGLYIKYTKKNIPLKLSDSGHTMHKPNITSLNGRKKHAA